MKKTEVRARWKKPDFAATMRPIVDSLFVGGSASGVDLRGLIVGEEGPMDLVFADLQEKSLVEVDFSFSELACPALNARIEACVFESCSIHDANFRNAKIVRSRFDDSTIGSVTFDDSEWEEVSFVNTKWKDRRKVACIGIRSCFLSCDFSGASLSDVEFRAARFDACKFDGATFKNCDFRGAKFSGTAIGGDQIMGWPSFDQATLDGEPWSPV